MIQQLPGWWDQIGPSVQDFMQKITPVLRPDETAQRKYEQMVQQDPTIVQKLSNMNPAERQQFAKGLGARNLDIFGSMPEGAQLRRQNEVEASRQRVSELPWGQQALDSVNTGTPDPRTVARQKTVQDQEDQKFGFDLKNLKNDSVLKELTLRKEQEFQAELDKAKKDNPNVDYFRLLNVMSGDAKPMPGDERQLMVVMNTPGLGAAMKDMVTMRGQDKMYERSFLASRQNNDHALAQMQFGALNKDVSDASTMYKEAAANYKGILTANGMSPYVTADDPSLPDHIKTALKGYKDQMDRAYAAYESSRRARKEHFGMDADALPNPETTMRGTVPPKGASPARMQQLDKTAANLKLHPDQVSRASGSFTPEEMAYIMSKMKE